MRFTAIDWASVTLLRLVQVAHTIYDLSVLTESSFADIFYYEAIARGTYVLLIAGILGRYLYSRVFSGRKGFADWACNHIVVEEFSGYNISDAFIKLNPRFISRGHQIADCPTKTALHRLRHKPPKCCSA